MEAAGGGETPSPQEPEPAEEPMEASEPEPSDVQEEDAEADGTGPEAGSSSDDVE